MCGIVGGISTRPFPFLGPADVLDHAIDSLAHRGPDDRGRSAWPDGRAFLGHRRLSIIDLVGGHQPIASEDAAAELIYNGEIYNFRSLRTELERAGHRFRTHTDGECALHAYQDQPDDFARRLDGMFAIAILDPARRRLALVRDRLGIKPLYYHFDGQTLIFASELKAILALLPSPPAVCRDAWAAYLRWKYIPAPRTIYEKTFELPPGCALTARLAESGDELRVSIDRYWDLDYGVEKLRDEAEAIEQLDRRLRAAVESHLEADVEIGALLSGGVDSSLVVALASKASPRPLKTFTVGFREPGFDQLPYARRLAQACGTEHREEYVEVDPLKALPRLVRCFDQPFADSSALACLAVCEVAARHVKVALTGDGGDETFAGYQRYQDVLDWSARDGAARRAWNRTIFGAASLAFSPEAKLLRRTRAACLPPLERYEDAETMCSEWLTRRLLGESAPFGDDADERAALLLAARARSWAPIETIQYVDARTYLPGDILRKLDRTSMACSLECRVPLLDRRVAELSAALDTPLKIRGGVGKYLLKKVAERYVPHELLYRKKRGFRVPIRRWFKGDLLARCAPMLLDGALVEHGLLTRSGVRWVLRAQRRPWMNLSSLLWALLVAEFWARERVATRPNRDR
ncbi:MAG: asparagine synthase (glutamine-hydrolyzing) [Phycisphaerae bacterium]|jgi:asparagine synthase (glutamine-hydrolysing)